jgi:hypothetical protein
MPKFGARSADGRVLRSATVYGLIASLSKQVAELTALLEPKRKTTH